MAHGESEQQKAAHFIEAIKKLNESMEIPKKVSGIKDKDIPLMIERALKEANPLFPVPKILGREDMKKLYEVIKE
ncbi:hypothetical protein KHA94_22785 [Bacillus sp. FJAT-49705]|uniref:Fe-containing alcohol dehydrogenase-like C-terminal domain-containing protein n=1 Tax=Cytobacillus citreus TaxID=2833586 RepID=A0ABS5NYN6_9BACI|nr:hypothetical protein [Cytobacillus citreus]MBS4192945.1 hypothetical protein [Cytobacillus citreus]